MVTMNPSDVVIDTGMIGSDSNLLSFRNGTSTSTIFSHNNSNNTISSSKFGTITPYGDTIAPASVNRYPIMKFQSRVESLIQVSMNVSNLAAGAWISYVDPNFQAGNQVRRWNAYNGAQQLMNMVIAGKFSSWKIEWVSFDSVFWRTGWTGLDQLYDQTKKNWGYFINRTGGDSKGNGSWLVQSPSAANGWICTFNVQDYYSEASGHHTEVMLTATR